MIFFFFSLLMIFFKWKRFIYVLIGLEFFMISVFLNYFFLINPMIFYIFLCFSVMSSIMGVLVMINSIKIFGNDCCLF
uniref:NADH dehydrogenase subunit 4L n=1 Tax=Dictyocaulus eckerti TaxID=44604 RepID=K7QLY0_DICEC|nr:NADH dehydrogenase subunit 4L [Dictyocaulus eckerti]AFV32096.1 NADH dehydrogenase subunit 4L [Dictyocaulus eckerti]